jgi:hypothetical protein
MGADIRGLSFLHRIVCVDGVWDIQERMSFEPDAGAHYNTLIDALGGLAVADEALEGVDLFVKQADLYLGL